MSEMSVSSNGLFDRTASQEPDSQTGYNFAAHFNLFSPFTSNLALEYCTPPEAEEGNPPSGHAPQPVWCMDVWNDVIAVGCGNGQIEAWNARTGSLVFSLTPRGGKGCGIPAIAVCPAGVLSGHMDGSLNLIGHNGVARHYVKAHIKPISVLRCHGDLVVTGSYDTAVRIYRLTGLVYVNAMLAHTGGIVSMATGPKPGSCVSGCTKGLVCYWEPGSGNLLHELEEGYGSSVVKVGSGGRCILALFVEDLMRVWDELNGDVLYTLQLDGVCPEFAVLGGEYVLVSAQSQLIIFDVATGNEHSRKEFKGRGERGVALVRHLADLDGTHVACSTGRDVQIIPCHVKLKPE